MSGHTPGPWWVQETTARRKSPSGHNYKVRAFDDSLIVDGAFGIPNLADARLIRSAPQMLQTIQSLETKYRNLFDPADLSQIRELIEGTTDEHVTP